MHYILEFHFEHGQSPTGSDVMAANIPKEWIYAKTLPALAPTLSLNTNKLCVLANHNDRKRTFVTR